MCPRHIFFLILLWWLKSRIVSLPNGNECVGLSQPCFTWIYRLHTASRCLEMLTWDVPFWSIYILPIWYLEVCPSAVALCRYSFLKCALYRLLKVGLIDAVQNTWSLCHLVVSWSRSCFQALCKHPSWSNRTLMGRDRETILQIKISALLSPGETFLHFSGGFRIGS